MGDKNTREVWDYLASCDYGLCHGPIDRINQVWVKDKRILCDAITIREDRNIDLEDIFGGDDAEGGVKGTIEFYMGTTSQVSSDTLAARAGRTSATFPGYRGLVHMFMRGKGSKKNKGFRWGSMNPYMPKTKVSVTDIPVELGDEYSKIPNTVGVNPDGTFIDAEEFISDSGAHVENSMPTPIYRVAAFANDGSDDAYHLDVADIGISSADMAAVKAAGGYWRATLSYAYQTAGSHDVGVELVVGLDDDTTQTFLLSGSGEDISDEITYNLPENVVWLESRVRMTSGTIFSETYKILLELAMEPVTFPADYIGYIGAPLDWTAQPGTTYDLTPVVGENGVQGGVNYFYGYLKFRAEDGGGGPSNATASLSGIPRDRYGNELSHVDTAWVEGATSLGNGWYEAEFIRQIPPGTATIQFRGNITLFIPIFHSIEQISKSQSMTLQNVQTGWCPIDGTGLDVLPNANPAHIIYECLVNDNWGRGESPTLIDTAAFQAAAATLYDERMGMSLKWVKSDNVDKFIQEVLDHIKAVMGIDPATGLWYIKLLRDDYDTTGMVEWNETNCVATNRKRRAWGETINQIIATYTDPNTEEEASVDSYEGANIAIQGGVVSEGRNYYGFRNAYITKAVADKDVIEAAAPLFTATLEIDRSAWQIKPGDVRPFSWAEDGITDMVVRVMKVNYGGPKARKIKVDVVEDIFAFGRTAYAGPGLAIGIGNNALPEDLDAQMAITAPYGTLIQSGYSAAELAADPTLARTMLFGDHDTLPILDIAAHSDITDGTGTTTIGQIAKFPATPSIVVDAPITEEVTSVFPLEDIESLLSSPAAGNYLMLGSAEAGSEIVMLLSETVDGDWNVARGLWDTIPRAWPIGTRLWAFPKILGSSSDPYSRTVAEAVDYYLLMRNTVGRLALADATVIEYTATDRMDAPFRPANVQLDSSGFAALDLTEEDPLPSTVTASWANRNRLTEDSLPLQWDDTNVTPETNQTVTLKITDLDGVVDSSITGLTGTSYAIPIASLSAVGNGYVEFWSVRDGVESEQAARRRFDIAKTGWGNNWGNEWGR